MVTHDTTLLSNFPPVPGILSVLTSQETPGTLSYPLLREAGKYETSCGVKGKLNLRDIRLDAINFTLVIRHVDRPRSLNIPRKRKLGVPFHLTYKRIHYLPVSFDYFVLSPGRGSGPSHLECEFNVPTNDPCESHSSFCLLDLTSRCFSIAAFTASLRRSEEE